MTTTVDFASAQHLQEMLHGYRQAQVLLTCTKLGIFEALAGGGKRDEDLALELALDSGALRRLLNAAASLGLLERTGDLVRNAPVTAACLADASRAGYMGRLFRREDAFYERWGRLGQAVQTGRRPAGNRAVEDAHHWVRDFEYALYDLARLYGPALAQTLDLPTDRPLRVLDVGGGHGGYSIALAERYPNLTAVVFDLPAVIEVTREITGQTSVADRVQGQAGDFMLDDLGTGYDLALLFGVLLSEPAERRVRLLRRVHAALKPGGRVVLREFVMDDDTAADTDVLLFDLQLLLSTEAGGALPRSTFLSELERAGFSDLEQQTPPAPGMSPIWLARRW